MNIPQVLLEDGEVGREAIREIIDAHLVAALREKGLRTVGDWVAILEKTEASNQDSLNADLAKLREAPQDKFLSDEDESFLMMMYGDPDAPRDAFGGFLSSPETREMLIDLQRPTPASRAELARMGIQLKEAP